MARFARVIALHAPHHITQRGNGRQRVFHFEADRAVYLQLLSEYCRRHCLSLAGYCLMSNHTHLVAVPQLPESLPLVLKNTHARYAAYLNARQASSGHVWQGRYYSCPLDMPHFWAALRYVERNPVRAGLTRTPEQYRWSSAAAHCGMRSEELLDLTLWRESWNWPDWREYLGAAEDNETSEIRRHTHTGRPLGTSEFVASLEKALCRRLAPARGGRPPKGRGDSQQQALAFWTA